MTFGERIQGMMEERDINQKQLACELDIPASTVRNYVRDLRAPDFETLKLFARFFEVSIDYLLDYNKYDANIESLELEVLRVLRQLTPEQRVIYLQQGKVFVNANTQSKKLSAPTSAQGKVG